MHNLVLVLCTLLFFFLAHKKIREKRKTAYFACTVFSYLVLQAYIYVDIGYIDPFITLGIITVLPIPLVLLAFLEVGHAHMTTKETRTGEVFQSALLVGVTIFAAVVMFHVLLSFFV
jgi:hypothetical protein